MARLQHGGTGAEVPYRPGIDGLRALAVIAVVLYHADVAWIPAGFLGVDVFFAISGYLICALLLAERERTGTISLRAFWARRARRLLPAIAALLVGVVVAALVMAPDAAARLRGDVIAAATYTSNWWQILRGESYFESLGRPPLLRHLWSLAVEEQFYVAFPVVFAVALRITRRRGALALAALAAAAGSALLMAALYAPRADPSRIYFGTDTRAVALCTGVALAFVWRPWRLRADVRPGARHVLDVLGVAAIATLALLMLRLDEFGSALYRGGFAATAVVSALAVAVAAHPASRVGAALGRQPLRWIGTRSYAIYLWHWPVFMLTRPGLDVDLSGGRLLLVRVAITAVLAEVSWRVVEQPFRTRTAQRVWRARPRLVRIQVAYAGAGACAVLALALGASSPARPPELLVSAQASAAPSGLLPLPTFTSSTTTTTAVAAASGTTTSTAAPTTTPSVTAAPAPGAAVPATSPPPASTPATTPPEPRPPEGAVLAIGDSVMAAAKNALTAASAGHVVVDAAVARQVDDGLDVLQRYRDAGYLMHVSAVVVHLGTNGPLGPNQFERLAQIVDGVPRIVVVNVRVPRRWEAQSNATITEGIPRHAAMRAAGWHAASSDAGVLGSDGVHPTSYGARVYSRVILEQLQPPAPPPTSTTTSPPPPPPA